jgi:lipopolysaccharide export system permease protein
VLKDVEQRIITEQGIAKRHLPTLTLEPLLSAQQIRVQDLPPDSLSASDLYKSVRALHKSGQNVDHYALALWKKLSMPLTTGAMVLLSLPFIFGSTRRITAGERIMMGSIVAIVLYLANQVIGHLGLLLSVNPAAVTMAPVAAVLWVALWRLRYVN